MEEREGWGFSLHGMIHEGTFSTRSLYTAAIQQVDSFSLFVTSFCPRIPLFHPISLLSPYCKMCFSIQLSTTADKLSCSGRMNYILSYCSTFNENGITLPEEFTKPFSVVPPISPNKFIFFTGS